MEKNMDFLNLIFPQDFKCVFCHKEVNKFAVCDECKTTLPFIPKDTCVKCGGRVVGTETMCIDCKAEERDFEKCFCILDYDEDIRNKILKFKSRKYKNIGYAFAHLMLEKFKTIDIAFDEIIPVPIHPHRRKQRGFNQSEILLSEIKNFYGRVHPELLERVVDTPHQAGLNRDNRKLNLVNAFKVTDRKRVRGKTILLVDDIFTTGSTINECAKTLYKAGAYKVYGLCLSRATLDWDNIIR